MPRRSRVSAADLSALAPIRVARVAALVALGLRPDTIAARVRSGQWQRPFDGVILMQSGPPTREQEICAALLYCGEDAVLSGPEAARRHGLRKVPANAALHVLVPEERRRASRPDLLVERTSRLPPTVVRDGVEVAVLERAVVDTARRTDEREGVLALVAEAVQRRRTTVDRLLEETDAGSRRGTAVVREILTEVRDGIRSVAEGWGRDLHARSGLPTMLFNPRLYLPGHRFLACPDGYIDAVGMAWEHHSAEFHPPEREDDDARRVADMVAAGVVVVSHRPRRLLSEPDRVLDELRAYYRLAASRPRPELVVVPAA
ncbi:hypothetical protein [Actinomycetospora termitidis]|uniref:Transcriptional regulator, AbiEi antitoxin, Type IV TA system n=1 Tax=Actinomycetospora termitidis TaxID=3053470 RepID=A0ABT7M280_9PSEU|nr:hypothetical protein [Actinomycetospora sp. Odt1-22]MDL5154770.1 hypothetical protein [Actinomycetospora sp. Odt1-22]